MTLRLALQATQEEAGKQRLAYAAKKRLLLVFIYSTYFNSCARAYTYLPADDHVVIFVSPEELVHANFSGLVSFFGQAADDFRVFLPRPSVVKNPLFHAIGTLSPLGPTYELRTEANTGR